jgi:hypothetical protein
MKYLTLYLSYQYYANLSKNQVLRGKTLFSPVNIQNPQGKNSQKVVQTERHKLFSTPVIFMQYVTYYY